MPLGQTMIFSRMIDVSENCIICVPRIMNFIRCVSQTNLLLHSVPFRLGYSGLYNAPQLKGATTP